MRTRVIHLACLLLLVATACGGKPSASGILPASTPTTLYLVTVPVDATPTPTPFQPIAGIDNPLPSPVYTDTPLPLEATATFDPNALIPATGTPQSFYVPPYAPDPALVLNSEGTVTFLLLGSDKRPGQTYFRTDTIVIAVIRPGSGQVALISVPRDLYVYIPTVGMDRVNSAYEYGEMPQHHYPGGGVALLKDTILYNLGLRIDHLGLVDFDGFRRIVDTLGGVEVNVGKTFHDTRTGYPDGYTIYPGIVHMDGKMALWYIRARKTTSDLDRLRRAQEVLVAIGQRLISRETFKNIPDLYRSYRQLVITDLTLTGFLQLAPLALYLNNADIRNYYIGRDLVSYWMTPGRDSVLLPNGPAIRQLLMQALGNP